MRLNVISTSVNCMMYASYITSKQKLFIVTTQAHFGIPHSMSFEQVSCDRFFLVQSWLAYFSTSLHTCRENSSSIHVSYLAMHSAILSCKSSCKLACFSSKSHFAAIFSFLVGLLVYLEIELSCISKLLLLPLLTMFMLASKFTFVWLLCSYLIL